MKNRTLKIIIATLLLVGLFAPFGAWAQGTTQTALGEVSTFGEFISLIWDYGSQVIIALAVFLIVLGAFFYVASGGNDERISQGKQMIFGSLIAILIVIFSGVLVRTLHKPAEGTTGYLTDVPNVISNATTILVGIIGAFSVLMLVYAGYLYVTARGDTDKVGKAHAAIRYAIYGLVIGLVAYGAVSAVINYFL
ncbi:hypothetical protein JW752_03520 [Candidatus Peregrinibacteria bacterium]|nr:hypothetical protein [Candidatus Peregrinibacteria bacterium]